MANFQVVKLSPEHWRLYRQLRLEALREAPQAFSSSYAEVVQRPDSHWQERLIAAQEGLESWLLFAQVGERLVGMVGAYALGDGDTVKIVATYVTIEKRGQGIASALMESILAEVSHRGAYHKAALSVNASQTAALALYQKSGFQIVGDKSGVMGDGIFHSGYIMELQLPGGNLHRHHPKI